ncbi:MAG: helix-turn-helix domain-containing protein [Acidimicrobiales bacterium]
MTRPALAATRAVQVLNFLTARPTESFTLSEIARGIGCNPASTLAVLQSLVDGDYLHRHPSHKTYSLGPAVVAVGDAALARHRVIDVARAEMPPLADECSCECVASVVVADQIVVVALAGRPRARGADVRVGQRVPMIPPLGPVFIAWSPDEAVDRWLDALGPGDGPAERAHYRATLASVAERGFSVGLESGARATVGRVLAERAGLAGSGGPDEPQVASLIAALRHDYEVLDLDLDLAGAADAHRISNIAAPVFGPGGDVVLALTLHGFGTVMDGSAIRRTADRLLSTTALVTRRTGGHAPGRHRLPAAG